MTAFELCLTAVDRQLGLIAKRLADKLAMARADIAYGALLRLLGIDRYADDAVIPTLHVISGF